MIEKISFKNYKSFKEKQELIIKPITILIGKNSSGKSAIAKLPTLIEGALSGSFEAPILISNNGIELGAEFRDLIYGREAIGSIEFELTNSEDETLTVEVASGAKDNELPRIRKWKFIEEYDLVYNDSKREYFNYVNETSYRCGFNGFNLDLIFYTDRDGTESTPVSLKSSGYTLDTNYVGPFRKLPSRTHNLIGNIKANKIGIDGENAYQILINDYLYNDSQLLKKVSDWYKRNFDGWGIEINTNSRPDYRVELTRENPSFSVNIKDVGQGMSQALPLVVSAYMNNIEHVLTIIEQPELHLHPAAHGNLAELFALATINSNNRFLIETHSPNFVLRLRRLVAEEKIKKENIIIYSVEYDNDSNTSTLKPINISDDGSVNYWPENIFSETLDETIAIRKVQLKKEKNGN